jgi:hypothetical protein
VGVQARRLLSCPWTFPASSDPEHLSSSSFHSLSTAAQTLALSPRPSSYALLQVLPICSNRQEVLVEVAQVEKVSDRRSYCSARWSRKHSRTIRQQEVRCEEAGYSLLAQVSRPACASLARLKSLPDPAVQPSELIENRNSSTHLQISSHSPLAPDRTCSSPSPSRRAVSW